MDRDSGLKFAKTTRFTSITSSSNRSNCNWTTLPERLQNSWHFSVVSMRSSQPSNFFTKTTASASNASATVTARMAVVTWSSSFNLDGTSDLTTTVVPSHRNVLTFILALPSFLPPHWSRLSASTLLSRLQPSPRLLPRSSGSGLQALAAHCRYFNFSLEHLEYLDYLENLEHLENLEQNNGNNKQQ